MNGIKATIRTDWQNLAHGQTRGIILTKESPTATGVYFSGIKEGDTATITMHVEWRGVLSWGKWGGSASSLQIGLPYSYQGIGPKGSGESGEQDVVFTGTFIHADGHPQIKETDKATFHYQHEGDGLIQLSDDGYFKITRLMCCLGEAPLPYIDSDELKATGGEAKDSGDSALTTSDIDAAVAATVAMRTAAKAAILGTETARLEEGTEDSPSEASPPPAGNAAEVTLVARTADVTTEQPRAIVTTVERRATII